MATIKAPGAPNKNKAICGKRPQLNQAIWDAMKPCTLKPGHDQGVHKTAHNWKLIA
jgi:hypothetical protein